jgi:hypothetical protein
MLSNDNTRQLSLTAISQKLRVFQHKLGQVIVLIEDDIGDIGVVDDPHDW